MKQSKEENNNRVLSMNSKREKDQDVPSSEVTRNLFSDIWRDHLDEVRNMAGELKLRSRIKMAKKVEAVKVEGKKVSDRLSLLSDKKL